MDIQYNNPWSLQSTTMNMMEPLAEMDGFEPQTRARSNTWPLPRPENYMDDGDSNKCPNEGGGGSNAALPPGGGGGAASIVPTSVISAVAKKNSSRRNAWGNLSYADLITQAITSAPDKRLTLSQIYEWMVQNVPYFKDKGDSNSSAGWKNSIRHNLSLHNRFMRVQNEGTGKSSWWMINPDAKPGKSVRRRAASMETSKFEKRRGRVKKKVEAMRNGSLTGTADATPSPSSSVSEGLDLFPDSPLHSSAGFQLSPDFRPRASSATSSCGRLSPIPAVVGVEPDWSSPPSYGVAQRYSPDQLTSGVGNYSPDQLAGNLEQGMKLQADVYLQSYVNGGRTPQQPPPPYSATYESTFSSGARTSLHAPVSATSYGQQCPVHRLQPCTCVQQNLSPVSGMSPSYPQPEPSPDSLTSQFMMQAQPNTCINTQRCSSRSPPITPTIGPPPSTMMGQLMGALNNSTLLDDLNLNIETLHGGFDCNVDEVIKHELSMDGSLDFNFSNAHQQSQEITTVTAQTQTTPQPAYSTTVTTPSWVH